MRVRRKVVDGVLVIAVTGLLRATPRSIDLFQEITKVVTREAKEVRVDLGGVLFVDSLWLGFLVSLNLLCVEKKVPFVLAAMSRQVHRVVSDAHLDRALPEPLEIV
jgi:anti-anti-sigma factor